MSFDAQADGFLQWALPQRGLRWRGFRRNRRQVYRRLRGRIAELGLPDVAAYRHFLDGHPDEWPELDRLCRVTISRFRRDAEMWSVLVDDVVPRLAHEARGSAVRAWSAGCGAGEEPYTLVIAWSLHVPGTAIDVLATDIDTVQLERARVGCFPFASLREVPEPWRREAFDERGGEACVRERFRSVRFERHDLRTTPSPAGPFDVVLCRNLAFSYFDEPTQRAVTAAFRGVLRTGGVLVVGQDECVPSGAPGFTPLSLGIHVAA